MSAAPADLAGVTLCAVTSVNLAATILAMARTLEIVRVDHALLFTDRPVDAPPPGVHCVPIAPLRCTADYSRFMLHELHRWIETAHCMVIQWDGYPLHAGHWNRTFLEFDYVGAPWPQFDDGHDVGNGGFSLRSRRLLQACLDPRFDDDGAAEDLVIARRNRAFLEREHAIRFADRETAARFSIERPIANLHGCADALACAFGFHGVFNMTGAHGARAFAQVYRSLDHRGPVRDNLFTIVAQLARRPAGGGAALRILRDWAAGRLG